MQSIPVTVNARVAPRALTGRRITATTAASKAMTGRELVFMFWWLLIPREHRHPRKSYTIL
jgi:hypothetical protein